MAVRDALVFRQARHMHYPDSVESERAADDEQMQRRQLRRIRCSMAALRSRT